MPIRTRTVAMAALVLAAALPQLASAGGRVITVVNATRYPIVSLRTRASGNDRWQAELLKEGMNGYVKLTVLGVGKSMRVTLPDYSACVCDFFVTFDDGHRVRRPHVDICKAATVKITDD